ncbi:HNH endonuclease signature motif containing protein [Streptomyces sp. NPDC004237]|uniref:HNH endonuclease n=1 Tax=Streptomyces sp. NPDC004237 TaxID=3154455 RepID=UPI0033A1053D
MSVRPIRTVRILSSRQRRSKKRTLYAQQAGRCATCGSPHAPGDLILKHKVHRKKGGTSRLDNLHLVCPPCTKRPGIGGQR